MRPEIDDALAHHRGAISRQDLLRAVTRSQIDDELRRGHLCAPFPRAYIRPWDAEHPPILRSAALASVAQPAALSHGTALAQWGLSSSELDRVHVTVPWSRHPAARASGLVVHRTRIPTRTRLVGGLRTVEPAVAVMSTWPLLDPMERRGPAIEAVRTGLVTIDRLQQVCATASGLTGLGQLRDLVALLAGGCESELEIWGHLSVFDVPGLRHGVRQLPIQAGRNIYRLDLAFEAERVAVEMDGERWHSDRARREHDRRRDAALASIGWLTLRFSWRRLHFDIEGCRKDTLATLAARTRKN